MIYITGDKHADYSDIFYFCLETNLDDILIVLGDVGFNYYQNKIDYMLKDEFANLSITLFCIHGNYDERPENIKTYITKEFHGGIVYYEEKYPNILFAKDGEVYDFNGQKSLVIGGAYSIDKYNRLAKGLNWYASEQPSEETKEHVRQVLKKMNNKVDVILSHTCPYKYIPKEAFMNRIIKNEVDNSTELFLDEIEESTEYNNWYCGHYHIDLEVDKMKFVFNEIKEFGNPYCLKKTNDFKRNI